MRRTAASSSSRSISKPVCQQPHGRDPFRIAAVFASSQFLNHNLQRPELAMSRFAVESPQQAWPERL